MAGIRYMSNLVFVSWIIVDMLFVLKHIHCHAVYLNVT